MTSHEIRRYELEAAALDALRQGQDASEVVQQLLGIVHEGTAEDAVIRRALLRLAGRCEPVTLPLDEEAPWEDRAFAMVAQAWCHWADGLPEAARDALAWIHLPSDERGAVLLTKRLVLYQWAAAVGQLLEGDLESSRRLWRDAIDLGGQVGVDATPTIRWTYWASR